MAYLRARAALYGYQRSGRHSRSSAYLGLASARGAGYTGPVCNYRAYPAGHIQRFQKLMLSELLIIAKGQ